MFLIQKYGGITKYFCELIKNLPAGNEYELSVIFSENQHLKDEYQYFKKVHLPIPKKESRIGKFLKRHFYNINKNYSKKIIFKNRYDLFHPTYYDPYFLDNLKKPYIITVHDLIEFKFQEQYKRNSRIPQMTKVIQNAARIISISENTKKDLIEILKINPEKIDVIHHGFNKASSFIKKPNIFGRYILFVGVRKGYKNFITLAKAFSILRINDKDLKLICVGEPFNKKERDELQNLKILENTIALGVDESTLNHLYNYALAFVYPTLYEGFGMPILEAFANNCPVCLSNTSSLPEVAGNGGIYFEPNDINSISMAISKVIYNSELSQQMAFKGKIRLNNFSWKKCAEETIKSYAKAIS